jgi:4-carboxymuconolactone decarboxylase
VAAAHPLLVRVPPVATLSPHQRVWTFLAAHVAAGDLAAVADDWKYIHAIYQRGGLEVILQTHLFAGYPRTINALAAVRDAGLAPGVMPTEADSIDAWPSAGVALAQTIYGAKYPALRRNIAVLHPALDAWMVEMGYGRVLSRPGLSLAERELCVLAVLCGQNVAPQLMSHVHGALHAGASSSEILAVLGQTSVVWGSEAQAQVDTVVALLARTLGAGPVG